MFEPITLSVGDLAERWNVSENQVIDLAMGLRVPLHFMFDGWAIDAPWEWPEPGATGAEQVAEFQAARKALYYRGLMRLAPASLFELRNVGSTLTPNKAFHPETRIRVYVDPQHGPMWSGRMMALEPSHRQPHSLSVGSLVAIAAEVAAIEAFEKSKKAPDSPADPPPAPAPSSQVTQAAPAKGEPVEPKIDRQDRRLAACLAAGLKMPANDYEQLPTGVGELARLDGVTRQAFSQDVKAALKRHHAKVRAGAIRHSGG